MTATPPPRDARASALLAALQTGLPLVSRPYAALAERVGMEEAEVITHIQQWLASGIIKRLGVVVRHRHLGYQANAMVVWDIPDEDVSAIGQRMSGFDGVTLCYRRPRRGTDWPYNLFCMIHGKDRQKVLAQTEQLAAACGIAEVPRAVLFSRRCFKQRGARYLRPSPEANP